MSFPGSIQGFRFPVRLARSVAGSHDGLCLLSPLEDLSSVDLKHTLDPADYKGVKEIFQCGNGVRFVENRGQYLPPSEWQIVAICNAGPLLHAGRFFAENGKEGWGTISEHGLSCTPS